MITNTILLTLALFLILSIGMYILLSWYARKLIKYIALTADDSRSVLSIIIEYENHLNKVYGMDTFYGDTTLESLLEHTKTVADKIENFVSTTEQVTEGKTDAS